MLTSYSSALDIPPGRLSIEIGSITAGCINLEEGLRDEQEISVSPGDLIPSFASLRWVPLMMRKTSFQQGSLVTCSTGPGAFANFRSSAWPGGLLRCVGVDLVEAVPILVHSGTRRVAAFTVGWSEFVIEEEYFNFA